MMPQQNKNKQNIEMNEIKIPASLTLDELVSEIERHNEKYWKEANPEISDEAYDALIRELSSREPSHPLLENIGHQRLSGIAKIRHKTPMLSLDKAYSYQELITWAAKFARSDDEIFIAQPKYDGISASLTKGVLATRGDGYEGEDISDKIPLIELEMKNYRGTPIFDARGEIIIRNDDFKNIYAKVIKKDGKAYKNQRNAVAGIVGLKNINEMKIQGAKLTLIDYETYTKSLSLTELKDTATWDSIQKEFASLPYPMDGIVLKLADTK